MQITNGKVTFERMIRPADYENKRAIVELAFVIGDAEDASEIIDQVGALAQTKALKMVGLQPGTTSMNTAPPPGDTRERAVVAPDAKARAAAALNAADVKETKATKATKETKAPPATPKNDAKDPAAMVDEAPAPKAGLKAETKAEAPDPAAIGGDEELFSASAEITDAVLMSKITQKNAMLKDPPKIRTLIGTFVPHPKGARDIAQANRQSFLENLEALT